MSKVDVSAWPHTWAGNTLDDCFPPSVTKWLRKKANLLSFDFSACGYLRSFEIVFQYEGKRMSYRDSYFTNVKVGQHQFYETLTVKALLKNSEEISNGK